MKKSKRARKTRRWVLAGGLMALAAAGAAAWRTTHPRYEWRSCGCSGGCDCEPDLPEHMASPTQRPCCDADEN